MVLAADYPFLDIVGTMLIFFAWVIWFWILIRVLVDVFRRHDLSGWSKAGWTLFMIVLPFLGVFIYLIAHGKEMGQRDIEQAQANRAQFDDYVRSVASSEPAPDDMTKAKQLLDSGAITQAEFEAIKVRVRATPA